VARPCSFNPSAESARSCRFSQRTPAAGFPVRSCPRARSNSRVASRQDPPV